MSENQTPTTYPCPYCEYPVPIGALVCPNSNCKEDLSALALVDTTADSMYQKALLLIKEGDKSQAMDMLHSAASLEPERVDVWVVLGKLYAQAGDYTAAARSWNKALTLQPGESRATAGLKSLERLHKQRIMASRIPLLLGVLLVLVSIWLGLRLYAPPTINVSNIFTDNAILAAYELQVTQTDNEIKLSGNLQSETERNLILAAVQAAMPEATIDASGLALIPPTATHTPTLTPTLTVLTSTATEVPPTLTSTATQTATPTLTPTPTPQVCFVTTGIEGGWLNLRSSGSVTSQVIDVLEEGTSLTLTGAANEEGWLPVISAEGVVGWVYGKYCR